MNVIEGMRRAVRDQKYRISSHANDEMADDLLISTDVEQIILTGSIAHMFTEDPRGIRYEVLGETLDRRNAFVVCRFLFSDVLLIITAYAEELED
jgi:hypothetical protein